MKKLNFLNLIAAAAAVVCAAPAGAANIVLWDTTNSFASAPNGADALLAFQKAANYWNKTLTNDVTINIEIGFAALDSGVLAQAGSNTQTVKITDVYGALNANTSKSALDAIAVNNLVGLNANGSLAMRVNGYVDAANHVGIDTTVGSRRSAGDNVINQALDVNQSVVKALGLQLNPGASKFDAGITFSSQFAFDFDPRNGVNKGSYDFTAVAIHELGHSLGFVSGADVFDYHGRGNGPLAGSFEAGQGLWGGYIPGGTDIDGYAVGSVLDLFRYGASSPIDGHLQLQWGANKSAFFSIDGKTPFNFSNNDQKIADFSTGSENGDHHQASHWGDTNLYPDAGNAGCYLNGRDIGIMDPTGTPCGVGAVTQNDLAAFDAMGWNTNVDALADTKYSKNTADIFNMDGKAVVMVPEPATWAQLLLGFGIVGGVLSRRRKAATAV
jgi:hypothetical protein